MKRNDNPDQMISLGLKFMAENGAPPASPKLDECRTEVERRWVSLGGELSFLRLIEGEDFDVAFDAYKEQLRLAGIRGLTRLGVRKSESPELAEVRQLGASGITIEARGRLRVMRAIKAMKRYGADRPGADLTGCRTDDEVLYVRAGGDVLEYRELMGADDDKADQLLVAILKRHGVWGAEANSLSAEQAGDLRRMGLDPRLADASTVEEARIALGQVQPSDSAIDADLRRRGLDPELARCTTETEAREVFAKRNK